MKRVLVVSLLVLQATPVVAQSSMVRRLAGAVQVEAANGTFLALRDSISIMPDRHVRTLRDGIAEIRYADGTLVTVSPGALVLAGGDAGRGATVLLGRIRVKAQRLLQPRASAEYRTPIAVAAIRGTEFVLRVDERTATDVFVFEGSIAVANTRIPERSVLVGAGEATRVEPFVAPTPPRPFREQEAGGGGFSGLERIEDPLIEAAQAPVSGAYLAFAVPTIDVTLNPAYMAEADRLRSLTQLSAGGFRRTDDVHGGRLPQWSDRWSGTHVSGRQRTLIQARDGLFLAVLADGSRASETRQVADTTSTDEVRNARGALGAGVRAGPNAVAMSVARSENRLTSKASPVSGTSTVNTGQTEVALGWVRNPGMSRTLGVSYAHAFPGSETRSSDGGLLSLSGNTDAVRILHRSGNATRRAGLMGELLRSRTDEDVSMGGLPQYREELTVHAVRGGPALGLTPTPDVLFALDVLGGISWERAIQRLPDGRLREDERDVRRSAMVHAAAQVLLGSKWLLTLDATQGVERQSKRFEPYVGGVAQALEYDTRTHYTGQVATGVGFVGRRILAEYLVHAQNAGNRPFTHSLVLSWSW